MSQGAFLLSCTRRSLVGDKKLDGINFKTLDEISHVPFKREFTKEEIFE